jgi:hypothetical protein
MIYTTVIIISCVISILLWFYFSGSLRYLDNLEQEKYNFKLHLLTLENEKLKSKIKDLEKYQTDVSKTFKILDNELISITNQLNGNVQNTQDIPNTQNTQNVQRNSIFSNLSNTNINNDSIHEDVFSNFLNRFLTSDINIEPIRFTSMSQMSSPPTIPQQFQTQLETIEESIEESMEENNKEN